ncbi:hypothetical protein FBU59_000426 [Linderina macrospora]|uniref:Uncharacterized protein n=1 Tax=Linderina macrospora TaxID=4868 RepID=A0ACC1JGW8_9FUNG|nr:hypothetical protein FBU59_000426 [Linderina macrospora]
MHYIGEIDFSRILGQRFRNDRQSTVTYQLSRTCPKQTRLVWEWGTSKICPQCLTWSMRPSVCKESYIDKNGSEKTKDNVSRFNLQCITCGISLDRDKSAARNIAMLGAFEQVGYGRPAVFCPDWAIRRKIEMVQEQKIGERVTWILEAKGKPMYFDSQMNDAQAIDDTKKNAAIKYAKQKFEGVYSEARKEAIAALLKEGKIETDAAIDKYLKAIRDIRSTARKRKQHIKRMDNNKDIRTKTFSQVTRENLSKRKRKRKRLTNLSQMQAAAAASF